MCLSVIHMMLNVSHPIRIRSMCAGSEGFPVIEWQVRRDLARFPRVLHCSATNGSELKWI